MPRPKKYENDAERHTAYRQRRSDTLGQLAHLAGQMLGRIPLEPTDDRKATYRHKAADERQAAKEIGQQVRGDVEPPPPIARSAKWFRVVIETGGGAVMEYVMEEGELDRLQSDYRDFKVGNDSDRCHNHGTYLYANQGPVLVKFPGWFTLDLSTATINETSRLDEFIPADTYSIQAGMLELFLSQKPRPNRRPSH